KNVKVSVETRGAGTSEYVQQIGGVKPWEFMLGIIKDAGANSNVDIGNVGAMNQQELHECIKAWFPYSSGNMHIKSSPFWDIGQTNASQKTRRHDSTKPRRSITMRCRRGATNRRGRCTGRSGTRRAASRGSKITTTRSSRSASSM